MTEKNKKTLLIASYKQKYSKDALQKISKIIQKMQPDRTVIVKVVEEKPTKELVGANVGIEEKNSMTEVIKTDKKLRADELASELLDVIKALDIPTEVCLRMGPNVADEIVKEFKRQKASFLIIHETDKSKLDKLFVGSTAENILNEIDEKRVILL